MFYFLERFAFNDNLFISTLYVIVLSILLLGVVQQLARFYVIMTLITERVGFVT